LNKYQWFCKWDLFNFKKKIRGHRGPGLFNKKLILDYYFCLKVRSCVFISNFHRSPPPDACKRNLCYIYSFVWFRKIVDHWIKQEKKGKGGGGEFYLWILQLNKCCFDSLKRKIKNVNKILTWRRGFMLWSR
jgi:hypothetical protein